MRPLALILLLLASGGVLRAQDQERKLMDTVLPVDMALVNPMQSKTFNSGNAGGLDSTKTANVKTFDITQTFSAKSFDTKDFSAKDFWGGDFKFSTKAADVKADSAADKIYETKAATVKEAHETSKDAYDTKGYATREAVEKGKTSQAHLNEKYLGKPTMNMDEVRDLLNKSHRADLTPITH